MGDSVDQPPPDTLEGGTRARRGRIVVALTVLSGLALVGFLLARPIGRTSRPAPNHAVTLVPGRVVAQVAFTDPRTGYVLLGPCRPTISCPGRWSLLRTSDAGRHWRRVASPLDGRRVTLVGMAAHGRRNVALVTDSTRLVSTDAGLTWHPTPALTRASPTRTVPDGDLTGYNFCGDAVRRPACGTELSALDPVTGIDRPLANQPALTGDVRGDQVSSVTGAGQVWVLADPPSEAPQLVHSPDGGLHWRTVPVPSQLTGTQLMLQLTPDGSRLYLVERTIDTSRIRQVLRLADPATGRWVPVGPPKNVQDPQNVDILPDGELRYADLTGNAWLVAATDHATGVPAPGTRVDGRRVTVTLDQVVAGVLVGTPAVGPRRDRILISTDSGHHWQVHPVDP